MGLLRRTLVFVVPKFIFGIAALSCAFRMALFGFAMMPNDLAEMQPRDKQGAVANEVTKVTDLSDWEDRFGYRLYARKQAADHYFNRENPNFDLAEGRHHLAHVLEISPLEPFYWLNYARLQLLDFESADEIIPSLRASYLSGRSEYRAMDRRFEIAAAIWSELDETDKMIAINDLILHPPSDHADIKRLASAFDGALLDDLIRILERRNSQLAVEFSKFSQSRQK